jgi:predicted membrane protein
MQFIEAGLVLACLLALVATSFLNKAPLSDKGKLYLIDKREFKGWGIFQNIIKFMLHTLTIISTYMLLGMTLTAHIAVVGFEVVWNYVAAPLQARYLHGKIEREKLDSPPQPRQSLIPTFA